VTEGLTLSEPRFDSFCVNLERDDELYHRRNLLVLRNPKLINFLNGCALSLTCHREGDAPVGLMLARFDAADGAVLAIGEAIEAVLAIARRGGN
jgi:aspartyl-tRNA(Asn)/glutamyl-tRNA(Gln) amidotransferase subunit A